MRKKGFHTALLIILFAAIAFEVFNYIAGPFWMEQGEKSLMDTLFLASIAVHLMWGITLLFRRRSQIIFSLYRVPELLFFFNLMLFLFAFIWALNANMDYVQRFAQSSANIHLAPDSSIERLNALLKYLPFLICTGFAIVYFRIRRPGLLHRIIPEGRSFFTARWGLFLSLGSSVLYTFAFPSFVSLKGFPVLGFLCFVPLLLVLKHQPYWWGVFYGVVFGVIQTILSNYWLGTFSLVSLQFIIVYYLLIYIIFMMILVWLLGRGGKWFPLIFASSFVLFDYLRSIGFMGYPWVLLGTSQYEFLPLIQVASVTGIWGVSFILALANGVAADVLGSWLQNPSVRVLRFRWKETPFKPLYLWGILFVVTVAAGSIYLAVDKRVEPTNTYRIALVQQNTDPRKDDYETGLNVLIKLTNQALVYDPDMVAWSETAFVPNIRRWSQEDPDVLYYATLVRRLLDYLEEIETWLVTGNDDYITETDEEGTEIRKDYNAVILFSDAGERMQTYHKIHLVPFTEYFPYKKLFPRFYQMLLNFDVNLWEPGEERVVFRHPDFSFSTPICFEDGFPDDIRQFILKGSDIILNLSNDFWSLTKVEAKQHYINSVFRAVENRRPFLRSSASGVTCYITRSGRLVQRLPYYEEGYLIADVEMKPVKTTLYTRWGDWFPYLLLIFIVLCQCPKMKQPCFIREK